MDINDYTVAALLGIRGKITGRVLLAVRISIRIDCIDKVRGKRIGFIRHFSNIP